LEACSSRSLPRRPRRPDRPKKFDAQGEIVKRAGATISLDREEARAKEEIEKAFAAAGLAVPAVKEVLSKLPVEAKRAEKILQILLRDKVLVRVTPDLIFHRDALANSATVSPSSRKTKANAFPSQFSRN